LLQIKVDKQLLDIIKKYKNPKTTIEKNFDNLYQSCIHYNKPLAKEQLYYFVQTLYDLIQKNNIYDFISWFQYSGFNLPFQILITNNIYDSKRNNINIVNGDFSFNNKNIYLQNPKRKQFLLFLRTIFYVIFGKNHSYEIKNILKVETEMSKYLYSALEENNLEKKLNFYSETTLHSLFHLDFSKIFHSLNLKNHAKVQIENPTYLKNISEMFLKKWNSLEWKEYWIYQIIKVYSSLDKNINDIFFNFFEVFIENKKKII